MWYILSWGHRRHGSLVFHSMVCSSKPLLLSRSRLFTFLFSFIIWWAVFLTFLLSVSSHFFWHFISFYILHGLLDLWFFLLLLPFSPNVGLVLCSSRAICAFHGEFDCWIENFPLTYLNFSKCFLCGSFKNSCWTSVSWLGWGSLAQYILSPKARLLA